MGHRHRQLIKGAQDHRGVYAAPLEVLKSNEHPGRDGDGKRRLRIAIERVDRFGKGVSHLRCQTERSIQPERLDVGIERGLELMGRVTCIQMYFRIHFQISFRIFLRCDDVLSVRLILIEQRKLR